MEDLSVQLMDMSVFLEVRTILFESTVVHINRDKLGKRKEKILRSLTTHFPYLLEVCITDLMSGLKLYFESVNWALLNK